MNRNDFFEPEDQYDMELPDIDDTANKIVLGCLLLLILFACFGFGCVIYMIFK